ncbi:MAG: tetratricopeptide repeat protein [Saprospiraceae bacterium]|nr:tetratricopeptide repeat protein [Saprospiraceae bacterium]
MSQVFGSLLIFVLLVPQAGNQLKREQASEYYTKSFRAAAQQNLDLSMAYADSCLAIYQALEDEWGMAQSHFLYGIHERVRGDYPEAKGHFETFRQRMEDLADTAKLASVHFQLGIINEALGDLDGAIEHQYQSIAYYESQGNRLDTDHGLTNLGSIYRKIKQYDKSEELYLRSLELANEKDSNTGRANNLVNLGNLYAEQEQYAKAIDVYEQAAHFDSIENYVYGLAYVNENIGSLLGKQGKLEEALVRHQKALEMRLSLPNAHEKAVSYEKVAGAMIQLGRARRALTLLDSAARHASEGSILEVQRDIAQTRARAYAEAGDFAHAYQQEKQFALLQDSILNDEVSQQISTLNTQYETEQKEQEIKLLNTEKSLQEARLKAVRNQRLGLLIGLLIFASLLLLVYRLFRKTKEQNGIIQSALEEKEVLLREIHHRVKNNLQFISSLLGLQTEHIQDPLALGALQEGQDRVQSMALIHQNLYQEDNLTGVDVQDYFTRLIRGLFDSYNIRKDQIALDLNVDAVNLDVDTVVPIGLIANELISNSLKYAFNSPESSGKIGVTLREQGDALLLQVADNGPGMKQNLSELGDSFGYRLIKVLSEQLKASMHIDAEEGTSVTLRIEHYRRP